MKTVLILTPSFLPEIGGVETRFNDICNELDRTGYKVYVLTYQPLITKARGLPRETRGNITIERIPVYLQTFLDTFACNKFAA